MRFADITVGKKKLQRQLPSEQYRAICDNEPPCTWVGPWHSQWNTWEILLSEVDADRTTHMQEAHKDAISSDSQTNTPEANS